MSDTLMVSAYEIAWVGTASGVGEKAIWTPIVPVEPLANIVSFIRRFVVLSDHQVVAIALWVAHTWAMPAADCTPYLAVQSATPRAGKSRLLEVLEQVVFNPWYTGRTSAAALIRKIDRDHPTLLLDESDATFKGDPQYSEALRGVLNTGYRSTGRATLCVGPSFTPKDFATFGAKCFAGIGRLPATVQDRSIVIELRRRKPTEMVERWRERDGRQQADPIRKALEAWRTEAIAPLRDARPEVLLALGDRAADVWEPLLAIADRFGGDWPARARDAAIALSGEAEDDSVGIQLLFDLRDIFGTAEAMPTREIIKRLASLDTRPWAAWSKGSVMTPHALARLLRPFGIVPAGVMRFGEETDRGYRRETFVDAWERYLSPKGAGDVERF